MVKMGFKFGLNFFIDINNSHKKSIVREVLLYLNMKNCNYKSILSLFFPQHK